MVFLHSETNAITQVLQQNGDKSSYVDWVSIRWHFKPYSLEDSTFGVLENTGSLFKFTVKGIVDTLKNWERLKINDVLYKISAIKKFDGLTYETTKILLTTEE